MSEHDAGQAAAVYAAECARLRKVNAALVAACEAMVNKKCEWPSDVCGVRFTCPTCILRPMARAALALAKP